MAETGPKKPRLPRALRRLLLWPLRLLGWALIGAVLWVAAYRWVDPPGGYYMAREWLRLGHVERQWRDLDAVSSDLARAVMAAEDAKFCDHWGFDVAAIRQVLEGGDEGRRMRGASTISQQVAKNVFLWHGRSWVRKGLEAGFTLMIEGLWGKRRILEVYLNVAELGEGVFGAEAAAQRYFVRAAARLSLEQAARLAAVLPDPKGRDPRRGTDYMLHRSASIADGAETLRQTGRADCVM